MTEKKRRTAKEVIISLRDQVKQARGEIRDIKEKSMSEARSRFDMISVIVENFEQVFETNENMREEIVEMQKIQFQELDEYSYQILEKIKQFSRRAPPQSSSPAPPVHVNPMAASMSEMQMRQKEMRIERQKKEIFALKQQLNSSQQGGNQSDVNVEEFEQAMSEKNRRIEKMNSEIQHYLKELQEAKKKLRQSESAHRRLINQSGGQKQQEPPSQKNLKIEEDLKQKLEESLKKNEQLQEQLADAQAKNQEGSGKEHQLQHDLLTKTEELETVQLQYEDLYQSHENSKKSEEKLNEILPLYEKLEQYQITIQDEVAEKDHSILELQTQVDQLSKEMSEKLEAEKIEDPRVETLENEVKLLREQLEVEKEKIDPKVIALESQVQSLKNEVAELTEEAEKEDPQISLLQQQLEELSERAQESESSGPQIESMQLRIEELQNKLSESNKSLEDVKSEMNNILTEKEEEISKLTESVGSLELAVKQRDGVLVEMDKSKQTLENSVSELMEELEKAQSSASTSQVAIVPVPTPVAQPKSVGQDIDFVGLVTSLESLRNDHIRLQEEVAGHHQSFLGDFGKTVQFIVEEMTNQRQNQVDKMVSVITKCIDHFTVLYESKELLRRDIKKLQKENDEMISVVSAQITDKIGSLPDGGGGVDNSVIMEPLFAVVDHVGELKNDLKDLRLSVKKLITDFGSSSGDLSFNLRQIVGQMIQMKDLEILNLKKMIEGDGKKLKQSSAYFYYQKGKKRGKKWDRVWLHFYKDRCIYIFKRESDRHPVASVDCKTNIEICIDEEVKDDFCIRIETPEKKGVFHRLLCSNKDDLDKWVDYIEKWRKK